VEQERLSCTPVIGPEPRTSSAHMAQGLRGGKETASGRRLVPQRHLPEHQTKPCRLEACQLAGDRLTQDRLRRCLRSATAACCGKSGIRSCSLKADNPLPGTNAKKPHPLENFQWRDESGGQRFPILAKHTVAESSRCTCVRCELPAPTSIT
jgi:hypothetical protein